MPVNTQWLFHLSLQKDELLSSWLVRVAFAHGCDPLTLTGCLWPGERVWTIDLDKNLPLPLLMQLASVAQLPSNALYNASLQPIIQHISRSDDTIHKSVSWILSLGTRNRKHTGGLQICPRCLAEKTPVYYRRSWRIAWTIYCPEHHCTLIDCCPACYSAIQPHRLTIPNDNIAACAVCGLDLSTIAPKRCLSDNALHFQNTADQFLSNGSAELNNVSIPLPQWFSLANNYIHLLRQVLRSDNKNACHFLAEIGININAARYPQNGLSFELCRTNDRINLLNDVNILLGLTPNEIISLICKHNVSKSAFNVDSIFPRSTTHEININKKTRNTHTFKSVGRVKSKDAVIRQWNRLLRKI